jgi:Holliday junction DNA helicase RuvA
MLEYIKGMLIETSPFKVTVDVQGLGYRILIPFNNYCKLPSKGQLVTLYISSVIREDSHKLFGFITPEQRDLFEHLIEVSGIGPKTGLALIGHMELPDLQSAIRQGHTQAICKIPGIGKKTAERLIVEMKDKIYKLTGKNSPLQSLHPGGNEPGVISDAISALINLGYHASLAEKATKAALAKWEGEPELAKLITAALRNI